jgi:hypothetical protein
MLMNASDIYVENNAPQKSADKFIEDQMAAFEKTQVNCFFRIANKYVFVLFRRLLEENWKTKLKK